MNWFLPFVFGINFLNPQVQELPRQQELTKSQIEQKIRKEYSLDRLNVNFGIFPENDWVPVWGTYSPWSDSLKINYYGMQRACKENFRDLDSLLNKTMVHELAHHHVDKIQERLGLKSEMQNSYSRSLIEVYVGLLRLSEEDNGLHKIVFQNFVDKKCEDLTNILFDKIVNEGIARYYENPDTKPLLKIWPSSIKDIKNRKEYEKYIYDVGFNLMSPIISIHGDKGIEYVLKNMPKYEDFSNLEEYQKNVLEKLGEGK
ncbi:MAG: hypothetical protein ACP5NZ_01210 [Nanobdellota archaeon]